MQRVLLGTNVLIAAAYNPRSASTETLESVEQGELADMIAVTPTDPAGILSEFLQAVAELRIKVSAIGFFDVDDNR